MWHLSQRSSDGKDDSTSRCGGSGCWPYGGDDAVVVAVVVAEEAEVTEVAEEDDIDDEQVDEEEEDRDGPVAGEPSLDVGSLSSLAPAEEEVERWHSSSTHIRMALWWNSSLTPIFCFHQRIKETNTSPMKFPLFMFRKMLFTRVFNDFTDYVQSL